MSGPKQAGQAAVAWRALWAGSALVACVGASAQTGSNAAEATTGPETLRMIDALKPSAQRISRNLLVRPSAPAAAASSAAAPPATPALQANTAAAPVSAPAAPASPALELAAEEAPSLSLPIQFEVNSARVRPQSGALLGNLVAALLSPELKSSRFVIEGHTDASGAAAANLLLSRQRADEVRLFLVALGVHPSRLKTVGKGSTELANPSQPLAAENRRVRVVTLE